MSDQREQIRDNANYLRNVRPIDPEEIYEYVDGQPHPGVVRTALRELSPDLGLRERDDGAFVPVEDGALSVEFDGVASFPERYARRLEGALVERFGPGWPEATSGDRLRERLVALKDDYLHRREVEYDDLTALAYAVYHLPDYYAAAQYVLADLAGDGLLPRQLRVVDVGAGVGGPALGLLELVESAEETVLDYHAVEPSANANVLETMLGDTPRNVHTTIHRERAQSFDSPEDVDLLLFGNVLNELDDAAAVVRRLGDSLTDDGSVVAIEPADRNTATGLRRIERTLTDEYSVYAPTCRLWPDREPAGDCWSFDVKPDLDVPPFQRRLEDSAGERFEEGAFRNVDVQYAYSVLRRDGRQRIGYTPDRSNFAALAEAESVVTDRVDCCVIKLSHDLADGGNPLFLIGDGSEQTDAFAVLTHESTLTADLARADYGDLLVLENVLVLWNDDEGAYNLVVDDEAVVDNAGQ